ncbi:RNA polymerase sigma factor [Dyadobacter psychrophilus]|uniref:RNA polymerase sigma-70 factor, ECF subfamily n=1 Tax=Dyadobacter psychrophilus TaxID=651661 RepID=A0A1T5HJA8_9BACT|nr:RNA polymerase sigma factor [Dyadobacter psychrophilus]SKC20754.1 RNA polymerase sigma-70 factor, ECF subfamily [Dyadobacter psychrophilus]
MFHQATFCAPGFFLPREHSQATLITLSIIHQAQQRDVCSQRKLFDAYGKVLHRTARRYLSDKGKVEDSVSNAIFIMLEKMGRCEFESVGTFESWIKRIVVNECLAIIKRGKPFKMLEELEVESYQLDEIIIDNLTAESIMEVIAGLPVGYRTVFNLYEIEGYSHSEISDMLGISLGTSKSQLSKAKVMLQKRIIDLDPSYEKRRLVL